jgi:hypothetical protein
MILVVFSYVHSHMQTQVLKGFDAAGRNNPLHTIKKAFIYSYKTLHFLADSHGSKSQIPRYCTE